MPQLLWFLSGQHRVICHHRGVTGLSQGNRSRFVLDISHGDSLSHDMPRPPPDPSCFSCAPLGPPCASSPVSAFSLAGTATLMLIVVCDLYINDHLAFCAWQLTPRRELPVLFVFPPDVHMSRACHQMASIGTATSDTLPVKEGCQF